MTASPAEQRCSVSALGRHAAKGSKGRLKQAKKESLQHLEAKLSWWGEGALAVLGGAEPVREGCVRAAVCGGGGEGVNTGVLAPHSNAAGGGGRGRKKEKEGRGESCYKVGDGHARSP